MDQISSMYGLQLSSCCCFLNMKTQPCLFKIKCQNFSSNKAFWESSSSALESLSCQSLIGFMKTLSSCSHIFSYFLYSFWLLFPTNQKHNAPRIMQVGPGDECLDQAWDSHWKWCSNHKDLHCNLISGTSSS